MIISYSSHQKIENYWSGQNRTCRTASYGHVLVIDVIEIQLYVIVIVTVIRLVIISNDCYYCYYYFQLQGR